MVDARNVELPDSVFHLTGRVFTHRTSGAQRERGDMLAVLFAFMIMFAVTIVKGLLSMHSLLENPFGSHPCKFPLSSMAKDHVTNTVAMLLEPAHREPSTLRRLFRARDTLDFLAPAQRPASGAKAAPLFVSAEPPAGAQGTRLVPLRGARVLAPGDGDAEADLLSPEIAGKVIELELVSVVGSWGGADAGEWEKRLEAVLTGQKPGPDGKGGPPETVWRLRGVRETKAVPSGGRLLMLALKNWAECRR